MIGRFKNKNFSLVSSILLLLLCVSALYAFNSPKAHADTTYSLVATDPYAASQPTAWGKTIWALQPYNNKLYVGYGDYGANTGPITIAPYDPGSNTFTAEWTSDTEEIDNFEVLNSKIFATATDRRDNADYAEGLPWADHLPVSSEHVFGMTTLNGTDLWMNGSGGANDLHAMLWHSTDGGATWQVALDLPPLGASGDFVRFYFAGAYNGKIYVQADHGYTYSEVWNGTSWSQGPDFGNSSAGWKASVFDGKMVFLNSETTRQLAMFDGTTASQATGWDQVSDYAISGGYLYTVNWDCTVKRTQDLVNWQTIGLGCPGTNLATSIAVLGSYIYVGSQGSTIYRLALPASGGSVPGDTNGDGHVDAADITTFKANWGTTAAACDFNSDGTVNILDFSILLSHYGT